MSIDTYAEWVADGEPHRTAQPIADLAATLRRHGYTVFIIGDLRHLRSVPPEDHTPYSRTGWPRRNPYPYIHAMDVMPPPGGSGLPSLRRLGAQLFADRQADVPGIRWLKYLNWEPSGSDGPCWHDSWQPEHERRASTDRGHLHLSARTDYTTSDVARDYDPVARVRGDDMPTDAADIRLSDGSTLDAAIRTLLARTHAEVNEERFRSRRERAEIIALVQQVLAEVSADPEVPVTIDDSAAEGIAARIAARVAIPSPRQIATAVNDDAAARLRD